MSETKTTTSTLDATHFALLERQAELNAKLDGMVEAKAELARVERLLAAYEPPKKRGRKPKSEAPVDVDVPRATPNYGE